MRYLISIILLPCAWWDIRTKKIPTLYLSLFMMFGFIYILINGLSKGGWELAWMSLLPGIFFLIYARVTGQMGQADGMIIFSVGCFLLPADVLLWIFFAFLFASFYAAYLLIRRKVERHSRFAFVPFLLLAQIFLQYICGGLIK